MDNNLFDRLLRSNNSEEEMRVILDALPPGISDAVWAAAIPHWFTPEVIAALTAEKPEGISNLFEKITALSFVEPFQDRGYNIHELSRQQILLLWWQQRQR